MQEVSVLIRIETKDGELVINDQLLSHIRSALYGRMGDWGWTRVEVEQDTSIDALRDDNKQHEEFLQEVSSLLPPSYDADEAVEAIIITFVKDMTELGRISAKLTSDYR